MDIVQVFVLVECVQSAIIIIQIYSTKKLLERLMSDPDFAGKIMENATFGFLNSIYPGDKKGKALEAAEAKAKHFFGFVGMCGQALKQAVMPGGAAFTKKQERAMGWMQIFGIDGDSVKEFLGRFKKKPKNITPEAQVIEVVQQGGDGLPPLNL